MKNKRTRLRQGYGGQVKSAQDIQDDIFRKMSASKKIKLTSQLTMLCLKLNHPDGNYKPRKTSS